MLHFLNIVNWSLLCRTIIWLRCERLSVAQLQEWWNMWRSFERFQVCMSNGMDRKRLLGRYRFYCNYMCAFCVILFRNFQIAFLNLQHTDLISHISKSNNIAFCWCFPHFRFMIFFLLFTLETNLTKVV